MTIELKKLCISNFNLEGTKLYWPPTSRFHFEEQMCVNKFVSTKLCMDRTFGKTPALSEFEINSGHFFVKLHIFVEFPNFSPKYRPAQGDYKLEVLTQHIFVVGGGCFGMI